MTDVSLESIRNEIRNLEEIITAKSERIQELKTVEATLCAYLGTESKYHGVPNKAKGVKRDGPIAPRGYREWLILGQMKKDSWRASVGRLIWTLVKSRKDEYGLNEGSLTQATYKLMHAWYVEKPASRGGSYVATDKGKERFLELEKQFGEMAEKLGGVV